MLTYEEALDLALRAHAGQTDISGQPRIRHVIRVAEKGQTDDERLAGLLHDVKEDCRNVPGKHQFVKEMEMRLADRPDILEALDLLTRKGSYQDYLDEYIPPIGNNTLAVRVKLNDLEDNIARCRYGGKWESRLQRYLRAQEFLQGLGRTA